jgi:hypothetical protein
MKHYLWASIALFFMYAQASDNPFDLQENFGKLDKEEEVLLSKLRKLSEEKELKSETIEDDIITTPEERMPEVKKMSSEQRLENMRQNALEDSKREAEERSVLLEAAKMKELEIQKIKDEQKRIEVAKNEAKEKAIKAAKIEEAHAVEAYEKERAKRAISEKKSALTKEKKIKIVTNEEDQSTSVDDINRTKEKLEEQLKADREYKKAVAEMGKEN